MKTVKIKFVGTYPGFEPGMNRIYQVLEKHYNVEITEDADYVICDIFGAPYEYCRYDQIRILYVGENVLPDFNIVDYAVSPYPLTFQDRHFQMPTYAAPIGHWFALPRKSRTYSKEFVEQKPYFANFIAGHESEYNIRGDFFKKLCEYKRVESPGSYLNNMPGGEMVRWTNDSKTDFQRRCKFTLCFESTKHEGFVTEKITDAFYADTIPVYYGSDSAKEVFNEKAYIHCSDYDSFDAVIEKIKELDNNDELYLEMLSQPILVNENIAQEIADSFEKWVCAIFDQPLEKAYRRSRVYSPKRMDEFLCRASVFMGENALVSGISKFYMKFHK